MFALSESLLDLLGVHGVFVLEHVSVGTLEHLVDVPIEEHVLSLELVKLLLH